MSTQIQLRHDTAANWTTVNPILALGEFGVETDTGKIKVGDGASTWSALTYRVQDASTSAKGVVQLTDSTSSTSTTTAATPNSVKSVGDSLATHTGASSGVHGVTGSVVGTTDTQTLSNKTLTAPNETNNISSTAFAGWTFDIKSGTVVYSTGSATANGTLNFRGDSTTTLASMLAVGQSITCVLMVTNGATAYYANGFQIDGNAVTPKWQGGTAPTAGNASAIDAYSFTIIKTAATPTYTVLASQTKFA